MLIDKAGIKNRIEMLLKQKLESGVSNNLEEIEQYYQALHIPGGWFVEHFVDKNLRHISFEDEIVEYSEHSEQEALMCLCYLANKYEGFSQYLPQRPTNSFDCPLCETKGTVLSCCGKTMKCPTCAGLGWRLDIDV